MTRPRIAVTTAMVLLSAGCIIRTGMNAECHWPAEPAAVLDLTKSADRRHLVVDAELIVELVDRHRFHGSDAQRTCEAALLKVAASSHGVSVGDVQGARGQIPAKGLNLLV